MGRDLIYVDHLHPIKSTFETNWKDKKQRTLKKTESAYSLDSVSILFIARHAKEKQKRKVKS